MTKISEPCPFCGEPLQETATQCRYCQESAKPLPRESVSADQAQLDALLEGQVDKFTLTYVRGAQLRGACLSGVDLFGADLAAADLRGADLGQANLSGADLTAADLQGANLRGADLSDAKLGGANLKEVNLKGANLEGALYDNATIWPDDFDPEAAMTIKVSS